MRSFICEKSNIQNADRKRLVTQAWYTCTGRAPDLPRTCPGTINSVTVELKNLHKDAPEQSVKIKWWSASQ